MRSQRGQATVEWTGLVLLASMAFGGLIGLLPRVDGRSLGGLLAHRIVCAIRRGCDDGDASLARAYGTRDAELVRANALSLVYEPDEPSLPVDYRRCREHACANAPDDRDLDAHYSRAGQQATAFTRRLRRHGHLYIEYWLYYPDSNTAVLGSDWLWNHSVLRLAGRYPGFHPDDWEGYELRIDRDGSVWARATSHGHWQSCKWSVCHGRWTPTSGWTRVSRGSHAGHVPGELRRPPPRLPFRWETLLRPPPARFRPELPGLDLHERTSTAGGIRLVPLEAVGLAAYRRRGEDVAPPWEKGAWNDPERGEP